MRSRKNGRIISLDNPEIAKKFTDGNQELEQLLSACLKRNIKISGCSAGRMVDLPKTQVPIQPYVSFEIDSENLKYIEALLSLMSKNKYDFNYSNDYYNQTSLIIYDPSFVTRGKTSLFKDLLELIETFDKDKDYNNAEQKVVIGILEVLKKFRKLFGEFMFNYDDNLKLGGRHFSIYTSEPIDLQKTDFEKFGDWMVLKPSKPVLSNMQALLEAIKARALVILSTYKSKQEFIEANRKRRIERRKSNKIESTISDIFLIERLGKIKFVRPLAKVKTIYLGDMVFAKSSDAVKYIASTLEVCSLVAIKAKAFYNGIELNNLKHKNATDIIQEYIENYKKKYGVQLDRRIPVFGNRILRRRNPKNQERIKVRSIIRNALNKLMIDFQNRKEEKNAKRK